MSVSSFNLAEVYSFVRKNENKPVNDTDSWGNVLAQESKR